LRLKEELVLELKKTALEFVVGGLTVDCEFSNTGSALESSSVR
jgi:hypothetical protein